MSHIQEPVWGKWGNYIQTLGSEPRYYLTPITSHFMDDKLRLREDKNSLPMIAKPLHGRNPLRSWICHSRCGKEIRVKLMPLEAE